MDPFSIAAGIAGLLQLTGACLKLGNRFLGPSENSANGLSDISSRLNSLNGTLQSFQIYLETCPEDATRLNAKQSIADALKRCETALSHTQRQLESTNLMGKYVIGRRFDKELEKSLKTVDHAKSLFETELHISN